MAENLTKTCTKCHIERDINEFRSYFDNRRNKHFRKASCVHCAVKHTVNSHRDLRGCINKLSDDEFETACELLSLKVSAYALAKFIGCCNTTAKKYLENESFY
jgi:hypothetical protein